MVKVKDLSSRLRILGGKKATKGRWPWQVALVKNNRPYCGGTILTSQFIITAAHCVRRDIYVRAGEYDLSVKEGTEQEIKVEKVFINPGYDKDTVDSDVAILKLKTPLILSKYVSNVCLPTKKTSKSMLRVNKMGTIIGWGKRKSSANRGTKILYQANVPIVNTTVCRNVYEEYYISNNMICAGYRNGKIDSCAGDSGGPLLFQRHKRWYIQGITSFGEGCGRRGKYGIYAKVFNFVKWIRKIILKNSSLPLALSSSPSPSLEE